MEFWKQYLDTDFNKIEENYKVRDKVITKCSSCGTNSSMQLANLKRQIKKLGTHLCWSCSSRKATLAAQTKYKATMLERYGVDNPQKVKTIKEKAKTTSKKRYGEGGSQAIARKAFKEKYGVDNPFEIQHFQDKAQETNLARYGTKSLLSFAEIRNKQLPENIENIAQLPAIKQKVKETMYLKYGGFNLSRKEIREKIKKTIYENYQLRRHNTLKQALAQLQKGVCPSNCQIDVSSTSLLNYLKSKGYDAFITPSTIEEILGVDSLQDAGRQIKTFCENNNLYGFSKETLEYFNLSKPSIKKALHSIGSLDILTAPFSMEEADFANYIKNLIPEELIIRNDRKLIAPLELDLYIPGKNLAFEFNGLIWHSELYSHDNERHKLKMLKCLEQKVSLVTIFASDWANRKYATQNFIKTLLQNDRERLHIRDLDLIYDTNILKAFINKNHVQGDSRRSKLYVGLTHPSYGIVAAISIAPHHRNNQTMVLNRVCFSEYHIPGALPKLLKYQPYNELITWSDNRWSPKGSLYSPENGFILDAELDIDYFYTNGSNIAISKQSMKKANIGCPVDISERDWCWELGFYRVWDCGKKRWKWKR